MKLFPFQTDHIIAINADLSRAVIRLKHVPSGVKTSGYDGINCDVKAAVGDPAHRRHRDAVHHIQTMMERTGHGNTGPNDGDNRSDYWYLVSVDTTSLRAAAPEWFIRKEDELLALYTQMQQDAVIPPAQALTRDELVAAKQLWALKLSGRLEETRVERARAAQAYADQKIGISTAGSHILD